MKKIAVFVTGVMYSHMSRIISGIRRCAAQNGCALFVYTCERRFTPDSSHDAGEYKIYDMAQIPLFDGCILINSSIYSPECLDELIRRIAQSNVPRVSVEKEMDGFINVFIDNATPERELVEHMIKVHGCKKIDFISGPLVNSEAVDRLRGYREALEANGIAYDPARVFEGTFFLESGERAIEYFLENDSELPDAVISANDRMALGAFSSLARHGLRVPEDVRLAGFDDDYEAVYHKPALSSVQRGQKQEGYAACDALLRDDPQTTITIDAKPVFRDSCGCADGPGMDVDRFRMERLSNQLRTEDYILETRRMAIDLTDVDSFDGLRDSLKTYIPMSGFRRFYLVLYKDVMRRQRAEDMIGVMSPNEISAESGTLLLIGYEDGEVFERDDFDMSGILERADVPCGDGSYIVSPLHYGNEMFGYCVCTGSEFPFESEMYYSWLMNISNSIESIRRAQLMQSAITRLSEMWCVDALTGIYNRAGFNRFGSRVWSQSIQEGKNAMLLFFDLNGLKAINDNCGHDEGDRYIKALANVLHSTRRHGEVVSRYGGDEFVVIACGVSDDYVSDYIESIERRIAKFNASNKSEYALSASVGCCIVWPKPGDSLEKAIETADADMYKNKLRGRGEARSEETKNVSNPSDEG